MFAFVFGLLLGLAGGYVVGTRPGLITTFKPERPFKTEASGAEPESLSRDELYKRAQEIDLPGRSNMSKEELQEALTVRNS